MSDERLDFIADDLREIRKSVDNLHIVIGDYRVATEHRITKVEQRSTVFGTIGGVISGAITAIFHPIPK